MQNHVLDPTYFYDAIEMFAFNYDWYVTDNFIIDDLGRKITKFKKETIRGSLQSRGTEYSQKLSGNIENMSYEFFCKSIYRINVGDFIFYKDRWLIVTFVQDYDEWGVRNCKLNMINLNNYKDLQDYIKYLNGEKII